MLCYENLLPLTWTSRTIELKSDRNKKFSTCVRDTNGYYLTTIMLWCFLLSHTVVQLRNLREHGGPLVSCFFFSDIFSATCGKKGYTTPGLWHSQRFDNHCKSVLCTHRPKVLERPSHVPAWTVFKRRRVSETKRCLRSIFSRYSGLINNFIGIQSNSFGRRTKDVKLSYWIPLLFQVPGFVLGSLWRGWSYFCFLPIYCKGFAFPWSMKRIRLHWMEFRPLH